MDRTSENWKTFPVLVIGDLAVPPPGATFLPLSALGAPGAPNINDFYIIVAMPEVLLPEALARLHTLGATPDQLLALLPAGRPLPATVLPFHGVADLIEGESADEQRARFLGKLEAQRQKKLMYVFHEATQNGLTRRLADAELARALDATRVAHALCCGYGLTPGAHGRILHACLEGGDRVLSAPWPSDLAPEALIRETALFVAECAARDGVFREALRERTASLPFRARNDLLLLVENSLGLALVLGGKNHAA